MVIVFGVRDYKHETIASVVKQILKHLTTQWDDEKGVAPYNLTEIATQSFHKEIKSAKMTNRKYRVGQKKQAR